MADVADKPTENVEEKDQTAAEGAESEDKTENGTGDKKTVTDVSENETDVSKTDVSKTDDEDDGVSKLERDIIRQVEYYFSDANLIRDKFLMEQILKETEGWVPLSVLVTFKRLAALSEDVDVIVDALLKSEEGLLEISEDRTKLRRHPERPIPKHNEDARKEMMSRTAYAKGFPLEAEMNELLDFFKPFDKVVNVTMRKYYDKTDKKYKFKGSVFVTFEKKEQTQSFIEKEGLSYKDRPLIRRWQESYATEKREERERERELKEKKKKAKKPEEKKIVLPKGTVLHFEGVDKDIKREVLREAIEKVDPDLRVAYIEFHQGDKEGHIRFHEEGCAQKYLDKLTDKKLKFDDDIEITLRTLGEDEEVEFLAKVVEDMMKLRNNPNKRGYDKSGGRKRRSGNFHNGNKGKKQKVDYDD